MRITGKKLFVLVCMLLLLSSVATSQVRYDVTTKTEFKNALRSIAELPVGSTAYVYIKGDINVGTLTNEDGGVMAGTLRNIHFVGVDDAETGSQATLRMEMQLPRGTTETSGLSLHFDNLRLCQVQGVWANSKHLIYFKDSEKHYIDTLSFNNCELTEIGRSIYRADYLGTDATAGSLKVFLMMNCRVHNGFRQSNSMPAFYFAQPVGTMLFYNNTFYDLPYLNSLVCFDNLTENTGRQAVLFYYVNNTVCAWCKNTLLDFGNNVGSDSEFHIKNNLLLMPTWTNAMNNRYGDNRENQGEGSTCGNLTADEITERITIGTVLTNLCEGFVQQENNVLLGYYYQDLASAVENGDVFPIGDDFDEEAAFSSMTMEDVGLAWTDFTDTQNGDFRIAKEHAVYTAGKNGEPLGNENEYLESETYNLYICGKQVTNFNCPNVLGDGVFKYNPAMKTLTVSGDASSDYQVIYNAGIDGLVIDVVADATLTSTMAPIWLESNTMVTGKGNLTVNSENDCAFYVIKRKMLTLCNLKLEANGNWGLAGRPSGESLVMQNVTLKAKGSCGAICDFGNIVLYDCNLVVPADGRIDGGNIVHANGTVATEVVILPLIGDANGDSVVDLADVVAIVNYILEKPAENFNIKAADINGDEVIDAADVVGVVNIILDKGSINAARVKTVLRENGFIF